MFINGTFKYLATASFDPLAFALQAKGSKKKNNVSLSINSCLFS